MGEFLNLSEEEKFAGEERREFLRLPYERPLKFNVCRKGLIKELQIGITKNVSQKGMLFKAKTMPAIDAIILIETDLKTLSNCIEVEDALVELNGRIMGKVVRVVPSENDFCEVGVQFIRVGEETEEDVASAMESALNVE